MLQANCECSTRVAKKYLSPEDFHLLARLTTISHERKPEDLKTKDVVAALSNWGISVSKAYSTAVDIVFLSRRLSQECPARNT